MSHKRPSIVLIVADDHGLDTGAYGNPAISTPHMDELAAEGVRFTNAFCTTASCAASRSVILTGLYNHANGTYGHTHGCHHFACFEDTVTLPALLNEAGYRTARVGKKHYAPEHIFPFQAGHPDGMFGRDDVRMSEACREFIAGDGPFFLYWCSHNPHRGGGVVEEHPFKPDRFGNPRQSYPGDTEQTFRDEDVLVPPWLPDIPEVRAELAQYYQSVARLDRGIGRLMQVLREEGKYDDTLIIYISDNGAPWPGSKTTLYEPGANLPLIVKSPLHSARGATCDGLVTWADLTPTILDFAGAYDDPEAFHGRSFKDIIDHPSPTDWREEVFTAHTFHEITNYYPMRVVRTKRYKFIWNIANPLTYSFAADLWASASWQGVLRRGLTTFGKRSVEAYLHRPRFELYDLQEDPHELVNLADKPEYAGMVEDFCAPSCAISSSARRTHGCTSGSMSSRGGTRTTPALDRTAIPTRPLRRLLPNAQDRSHRRWQRLWQPPVR
ncbi:MAG: sulfatase [Armatimonadetes bacterium]|nr:sulfatase [Armatimonadota bacterium]